MRSKAFPSLNHSNNVASSAKLPGNKNYSVETSRQ
jgi:hypothetical protein